MRMENVKKELLVKRLLVARSSEFASKYTPRFDIAGVDRINKAVAREAIFETRHESGPVG